MRARGGSILRESCCSRRSMFGLTSGLINGQAHGWGSDSALVGFGIGLSALIAFVIAESVQQRPMLDLKLFRIPRIHRRGVGDVRLRLMRAGDGLATAAIPAEGLGRTPLEAGFAMLPFALAMLALPYVGRRLEQLSHIEPGAGCWAWNCRHRQCLISLGRASQRALADRYARNGGPRQRRRTAQWGNTEGNHGSDARTIARAWLPASAPPRVSPESAGIRCPQRRAGDPCEKPYWAVVLRGRDL